jgi:hypothetical protein
LKLRSQLAQLIRIARHGNELLAALKALGVVTEHVNATHDADRKQVDRDQTAQEPEYGACRREKSIACACPSSDDLRQRSVFGSEALAHLV